MANHRKHEQQKPYIESDTHEQMKGKWGRKQPYYLKDDWTPKKKELGHWKGRPRRWNYADAEPWFELGFSVKMVAQFMGVPLRTCYRMKAEWKARGYIEPNKESWDEHWEKRAEKDGKNVSKRKARRRRKKK